MTRHTRHVYISLRPRSPHMVMRFGSTMFLSWRRSVKMCTSSSVEEPRSADQGGVHSGISEITARLGVKERPDQVGRAVEGRRHNVQESFCNGKLIPTLRQFRARGLTRGPKRIAIVMILIVCSVFLFTLRLSHLYFVSLESLCKSEVRLHALNTVRGVDVLDTGDLEAGCSTLAGGDG